MYKYIYCKKLKKFFLTINYILNLYPYERKIQKKNSRKYVLKLIKNILNNKII